jgi:two-component system CheB/CheR fusion protein
MEKKETPGSSGPNSALPIVGIGASAGGLYALKCFLAALPREFGFAIVFLQHLSPTHRSLLPELLAKGTPHLEVFEITDGMEALPNKLFLCPPGKEIKIQKGFFHLADPREEHVHLPIDEFFISLAEEAEDRAIAVILSGAGTDGARGTQAIRSAGGTVFAQDPSTAEFPSMPLAAISTGQVDEILKPDDIARELVKLVEAGAVRLGQDDVVSAAQFETFYRLIREKTGYRFNHYKQSVVNRRIRRRMFLSGVTSVQDYIEVVAEKEQEAAALASDLMIGVTSFFRDQLAWKALKVEVIRHLVASSEDSPVRVWTPACASGEEAYSIAMLLHHELALAGKNRELQVFATDVNDRALEKAREGTYPASIAADVPADLMRKYFTTSEDGQSVAISKELRERVVFAKQDLMTDPPFSRLDLLICRNFLIYLEPDAQEKSIALFHYALKDNGYLFLGNAESTGRNNALFKSVGNKKCRVYRKLERTDSTRLSLSVPFASERTLSAPSRQALAAANQPTLTEIIQNALLEEYAPAAIAINHNYDILYHNGQTNRYLLQPRGLPTQNLLLLLPEDLRSRIRGAIYRAAQEAKPVSIRASFPDGEQSPRGKGGRKKSASIRTAAKKGANGTKGKGGGQGNRAVTLRISKLRENFFLLVFHEKRGVSKNEKLTAAALAAVDDTVVRQLESELSATRADLQSNIEQLKSLNEELQSSNEELQAANEELETSREELQSLNEELLTVNTQLQAKIEEQEATNNDLNNFLTSTNIPTIFLDHRFRVKRFTPAMSKLLKLIPSDVGRPIIDMSQENLGTDLIADAQSVLDNLVPLRKEIAVDGVWYIRATLPYRTTDSRIEGVVITYTDITERKRDEEIKGHLSAIVESADEAIISKDLNGMIQTWNTGAKRIFGYTAQEAIGKNVSFLAPPGHVDEVPEILKRIAAGEHIAHFETERMRKDGTIIPVSLTYSPIRDAGGRVVGVSKICHDISERRKAEKLTKHLASFPQLNPNPVIETDSAGNIIYFNPVVPKILASLGMNSEDASVFLPADFDDILKGFDKKEAPILSREITIKDRVFGQTIHFAPQFNVVRLYVYDATEQKQAEEELRKSEELFRLAMDNMPDAIAIYDAERRYEFVNAAGLRRLEKPLGSLIGRRIDELYDEKTRSAFWPALLRTYASGTPQTIETSLTMPTGQYDLVITFVPMLKDGRVERVLSFTFDITDRKKAEAEIQTLARQRQVALDAAHLGWWQYNPVTRVADWDDGYKAIFGVSGYTRPNDEILAQIIHPDDLAGLWAKVEAALNPVDPQPYAAEYRINRPDGMMRWIEAHGIATFEGEGAHRRAVNLVGTVADITERKLAEEAIIRAKEDWESTFNTVPDLIALLDCNHTVIRVNKAMADKIGLTPEQCIGAHCYDAVHGTEGPPPFCPHTLTCRDGKEHIAEVHEPRLGGDFLVSTNPMFDERGQVIGTVHVARDITERKKMEEALHHRTEELETINKELEAFIYSVSHDLRAPLRTMAGFSKILIEDCGSTLEEQPKDYLLRITNASEKMTELIEDLLRLSRISKQDMDRVDYDLSKLASSIVAGFREIDPGRSVEVVVAEGLCDSVDPNLIRVALANLIDNAWKFTSKTTNARIEFGSLEKEGKTVYYVRDNGAGFDKTYADKMFFPFQRLHTEKEFEGTGIGLAIVERIIRRHGGAVWAEGEVGKGSTVFFTLG